MAGIHDFETLLRRLNRRERLPALVAALGLDPRLDMLPPPCWEAEGVVDEDLVKAVVVAAERGTLRMLLLELREAATTSGLAALARSVRGRDPARQHLFVAAAAGYARLTVACFGLAGELRHLTIERAHVRPTDVEALEEMVAAEGEGGLALAVRYARALDRSRVTRQFFDDFASKRAQLAAAWTGVPARARADREQLALLFLCRLMFLYFLQRRGHLAGDRAYFSTRRCAWARGDGGGRTFFRGVLEPLFFGALNRRPSDRDEAARALGAVPYLNGGLFERHAIERRYAALDVADDVVAAVVDGLFERYRFTTRDAAEDQLDGASDAGIDPEMLGKVFEGMMAAGRRGETGTFYTPAAVVDRLVGAALGAYVAGRAGISPEDADRIVGGRLPLAGYPAGAAVARAVREVRVLDPACGSGAFLLGALSRLARLREAVEGGDPRRDVVGHSLHGVDVQGDAALLCALRLWLALTVETERAWGSVPPLPNLDRRIRQGDALLDPLDLGDAFVPGTGPDGAAANDAGVRRALRSLAPAGRRYLEAEPAERDALKNELAARERELAGAWLAALDRRLGHRLAELGSDAAARDLWGAVPPSAAAARTALPAVAARRAELTALAAALEETGALPFFSFRVHFPEAAAGFDLVLSNPPWVRAHRWPAAVGRLIRRRYSVCREPGWKYGATLAGAPVAAGAQVDLSQLFLERSLTLLAPRGVLAMLLPAKSFRSLYGGPARRLLLRDTRIVSIEDHSLDQRSVFRADAFAGAVVARRAAAEDAGEADAVVRVAMLRRGARPLRFEAPQRELPLFEGDLAAPWLVAPADVRSALRRMQSAGAPLGTLPGLRVRRGVFTGANDVLLVREAAPRLGGLCRMRAEGHFRAKAARAGGAAATASYEAIVESSALRPLLRGSDLTAWRYRLRSHVVWVHGEMGEATLPPPRMRRYLLRHEAVLRARSGTRAGGAQGALFRVTAAALGAKVAWHDLAETLNAVALPRAVRSPLGESRPIVPLNTLYYIAVQDDAEALLLAAYFNALPVRTFARAIAERAKDARFRFFAWTIAALPLPAGWRTADAASLVALAAAAHEAGAIDADAAAELDDRVARAYGLGAAQRAALARFDRWLRGVP